jgi:hypothetical protein
MFKMDRSTITWSLSLATFAACSVWIGLFAYRACAQQRAIAALFDIEVIEYMCVLPPGDGMSVPAGAGIISRKVSSPIEFSPHGPAWLRTRLGEDRCRNWIDTPVAVNLAGSEAGDADLPQLACFSAVKKLNLIGTKVTPSGLNIVRHFPVLEELSYGSDSLTAANLDCLVRLNSLRRLSLYGEIEDEGLDKLSHLPKLTELRISSPKITDEGLKVLAGMVGLEKFSLSAAAVTDSGVCELSRLPCLTQLYLGEIRDISGECLDRLREERPGIAIAYEPFGPAP